MPFTNYALDNFVSQQLSQLTQFNAPEVSNRYPQRKFWVSNFSLNSIFGGTVSKESKTFSFFFLRRSEAAFTEYEYACQALKEFVNTTPKSPSLYFRALHHFEMVVSMLSQAYDLHREISNQKRYKKKDGSKYQRLNWVYNKSRHFKPSELSAGNIHVVWLTNSGLQTAEITDKSGLQTTESELSYSEIESFLIEIGSMADNFCRAGK